MCDTVAIVESARVLFAKNSDRDPNEAQHLDWRSPATYPAGARLRCTWIEIPQARQTHAVLLSRPFWIWGAEMGANEHGVAIGNEAVFTRQPYAKTGLTGMDLVRLALERAATASAAVQTIVDLLQAHGQGGGCGLEHPGFTYHNSFIVADPRSAFVLETAGRRYAIEEIRGARSISNGLTIPAFAREHSDSIRTHVSGCKMRCARTRQLAERAAGVGDLMRLLRDHGAGSQAPELRWFNGGLRAPCVHGGGVVASSQTTASWVAELRPDGCAHWATATAAPCLSLFKPVAVDQPLDLGPLPADKADDESLWWRHERLHRVVMRGYPQLAPIVRREYDEVERAWLAQRPTSKEAFAAGDRLLAELIERVGATNVDDDRPRWLRRYWDKRNDLAGLGASPRVACRAASG